MLTKKIKRKLCVYNEINIFTCLTYALMNIIHCNAIFNGYQSVVRPKYLSLEVIRNNKVSNTS